MNYRETKSGKAYKSKGMSGNVYRDILILRFGIREIGHDSVIAIDCINYNTFTGKISLREYYASRKRSYDEIS